MATVSFIFDFGDHYMVLENSNSRINFKDLPVEQVKSFISEGLLEPREILQIFRASEKLKEEFKSKEFLDYLFEKGLKTDESVPNSLGDNSFNKAADLIVSFFPLNTIIDLFKRGVLTPSSDTVNALYKVSNSIEKRNLVIELLKENLLPINYTVSGEPLIIKFSAAPQVRDHLINQGAFEYLNVEQKHTFVVKAVLSSIDQWIPDPNKHPDQAIRTLEILKDKNEYIPNGIDLYAMLWTCDIDLMKLAIDNGLDLSKLIELPNNENFPELKYNGLYPIQFYFTNAMWSGRLEPLKFLVEKGVDLSVLTKEGYSLSTKNLISHYGYSSVVATYLYEQGVKPHVLDFAFFYQYPYTEMLNAKNPIWNDVEKYFAELDFNQIFSLPDLPLFTETTKKLQGVEKTSITHIIVSEGYKISLEYLLTKNININALDSNGKTPIFYAKTQEIIDILIENGARTDVIDNNGNSLLHSTTDNGLLKKYIDLGVDQSIENNDGHEWYENKPIKQLVENDLLPNFREIPNLVNLHLQKGNILDADFFYNKGAKLNFDLHHDLVQSLKLGITASKEVNKFQALIAVFNKNGIQLPSFLHKYLNDPKDYESTKELEMVLSEQFLYQLVDSYILNLGTTEYNSYVVEMNQIVKKIEEDLALEVLAINKLMTTPLEQEYFVYRGLKLKDIPQFIDHNFVHGHKVLLKTGVHNFGFHAKEPWSKTVLGLGNWEFSGNYVSFSKNAAQQFATTFGLEDDGVLMKIKISPETKAVCGRNEGEFELITLSTIPADSIKSITLVSSGEEIFNPNYIESALDSKASHSEYEMIANFKSIGCNEHIRVIKESMNSGGELSSYEKFIETFTPEEYAKHREIVHLTAESHLPLEG